MSGLDASPRSSLPALCAFRALVAAALGYSLVVVVLSIVSLAVLLDRPYGGFLWSWDNTHGIYRVDNFSPNEDDTLQPADFVLAVEGQRPQGRELYVLARAVYQAAASVCSQTPPADAPVVHYQVLRRGALVDTQAPVRCFRLGSLVRIAAIPVALGLLVWGVGTLVYAVGPAQELNLVFAFFTACVTASIVTQGANVSDIHAPFGRFVSLGVTNPCPVFAAASLYHLIAILPRQHPSVRLFRTRWLWYGLLPLALITFGSTRYVLSGQWSPLMGSIEIVAWWGIALYLLGAAVVVIVRCTQVYLTSSSRQAKSQARLLGLSTVPLFLAAPFQVAQQEPQIVSRLPINQPVLLFWLIPMCVMIAFAILRFQIFPGRTRGLNLLVGLAVTVILAMTASPILSLDPEPGFVALLTVLAAIALFWVLPNPVLRVMRHFALPGTIERVMIERFNTDIQDILDRELLPGAIVQSLEKHLRLRFAAFWLENEPGILTLEAFTDRAPAASLPYELATDAVWPEAATRVESGPLAAANCKIILPLSAGGRRLGIIGLGERWTEEIFDDTDLAALEVMSDQAALAVGVARQLRSLQMVPLQLEQAQLDERDRIAQDLHDSTQAQLTQLAFALERVRTQLYEAPVRAENLLDHCVADINEAARDLRAILRDLIPQRLAGHTLAELLQAHVDEATRCQDSVQVSLQVHPQIDALLSDDRRMALLRICQQALDNALAHAQARTVSVTLQPSHDGERVEISVVDDGRGFAPQPTSYWVERGHLGVYIMTSRAVEQGGQLTVDSTPGRGTVIKGFLPAG
jgi:signal transduction histidine kinase